jgi:SAM-dependent methyltransferase
MNDLVRDFRDELKKSIFGSLGEPIGELENRFGETFSLDFEEHLGLLRRAFPERPWPSWAVEGFIRFNREILREEKRFRQSGKYSARPEDFDRILEDTYDNSDVMQRYYLVGLYCSYFVWPHHYEILSFFREAFLNAEREEPETLSEWGVGHGLFSLLALRRWKRARAVLADISRHSLSFSQAILTAAGCMERCVARIGDVTKEPEEAQVDRIICGELLEHVPEPEVLLDRMRRGLRPGGVAYLTGAVNAPQSDHVSLFRSPEELIALVERRGFQISRQLAVCHPKRRGELNPPMVVAMVVESAN